MLFSIWIDKEENNAPISPYEIVKWKRKSDNCKQTVIILSECQFLGLNTAFKLNCISSDHEIPKFCNY